MLAGSAPGSTAALPPLPKGWPTTLQLGLTDAPGGGQAARGDDDAATVPAVVPHGPQTAASFAQEIVALRDRPAPNVGAYHLSCWGTSHDIVYEDPPDATVRAYATRSARFYRSRPRSLCADDDGGFFRDRARAYYRRGALRLP